MPRPMTTAYATAVVASVLKVAVFVKQQFVSGTIYVWSGIGPITWNGQTWLGLGNLGKISMIEEGTNVQARGIVLSLSGIDPTFLAAALGEFQQELPVTVYLTLFDGTGNIIDAPAVAWAGMMDSPVIQVDGTTATISIACESRLVEMNVPVDRRYDQEDQNLFAPGDLGMQFVNGIQEVTINWGSIPSKTQDL